MSYQKDKNKIMKELLRESDAELTDEELVKEILGTTIAENSEKRKDFVWSKSRRRRRSVCG